MDGPKFNTGEGRHYFYSRVGDGGLSITSIDGYIVAMYKNDKVSYNKDMIIAHGY